MRQTHSRSAPFSFLETRMCASCRMPSKSAASERADGLRALDAVTHSTRDAKSDRVFVAGGSRLVGVLTDPHPPACSETQTSATEQTPSSKEPASGYCHLEREEYLEAQEGNCGKSRRFGRCGTAGSPRPVDRG